MMTLGRMKALFASVDQRGWSPVAEAVLAGWEHEPGTAGVINASSNFAFGFRAGGERRILRFVVAEPNPFERHSRAAIQAELDFIRYLAGRGLHAARPLPSRAGRWVESLDTPIGPVHATVFEAMEGEIGDFEAMPVERYPAWGRALAGLHNAAQGYSRPGRPSWRDHLDRAETAAREVFPANDGLAFAALDKLRRALVDLPVSEANYGLIHYDLCPDNLFWQDGWPGYIDFDDASYDWHAADLAYAIRDLVSDRASRFQANHPAFQQILSGYHSARPLPDEEVRRIPLFLIASHFLKYVELPYIIEEGCHPGEPAWTQNLRLKLAAKVAAYRAELELFHRTE